MKGSQAYYFGDSVVQQRLGNTLDMLKSLLSAVALKEAHMATDSFGKAIWAVLPLYCHEMGAGDDGSAVGSQACKLTG